MSSETLSYPHPLENGCAPAWVSAWGEDEKHGPWADFEIKGVIQRMRWIPPGVFRMGSDDGESYLTSENPSHLVKISRGYWLFDSPCTQELWEAVMGENPSEFKGPKRPVESVSWEDCQQFLSRVNEVFPTLRLRLPSEAEWEYACRATSEDDRYGDLDEIAWYTANSDEHTHPVKEKAANAWGLYDMLGNVWEWVQDYGYREYTGESVVDPLNEAPSDFRVIRGGSCFDVPGYVRAAYRGGYPPSGRDGALGFRCASSE